MRMDSIFVPSGEASAILSQLSSSRLDLRKYEGLNGSPETFYNALSIAHALSLGDNPFLRERLDLLESYGVSVAMGAASSLDRMASVLPGEGNLRWSSPTNPVAVAITNRSGGASGERMPPEPDERVFSEGDSHVEL